MPIPRRYKDACISQFDTNPGDFLAKRQARGDGLFIGGPNGTGKTHMACAIAKEVLSEEELSEDLDQCFVPAPMALAEIRSSYNGNGRSELEIIKDLSSRFFLILDDLGAEKQSEHAISTMYVILSQRINNMLPTIVTSNIPIDAWHDIEPRIGSRLAGMMQWVIDGKDRRTA